MFPGIRSAVFFGAHTDDEMIAAGTLHRLARAGVEVRIVAVATAATKEDRTGTEESYKILLHEFKDSAEKIGAARSYIGLHPSSDFHPHRQTICQHVFDYCETYRPDLAFVLSPDDENSAHRIVGEECERVMRGRVPYVVRCQFPWNYSIGRANLFVKLYPGDVQCKRDVINCYQSQLWRYRYEEMLLSYARADGLSVKVPYAEKFELLRGVV